MPRVLKSTLPPSESVPAPFAFDDLGHSAKAELEQSRQQADEILDQARREAAQLRQRAEAQGKLAAQEAAERAADERTARQLETLLPALRQTIDELQTARHQWLLHWEQSALRVVTAIAQRVIRREVERSPEISLALIREALELAAGTAEVQLRLHPDDAEALGGEVERLLAEVGRLGEAVVVADPAITRGGCRVDTRHGSIDQQFEAQLARIAQELL